MNEFANTIEAFIEKEALVYVSDACEKIAIAMIAAIRKYTEDGGKNDNSFSVNVARLEDDSFESVVAFYEDCNMTIMYRENTDNQTVQSMYELTESGIDEVRRIAGLMLGEEWVDNMGTDDIETLS
ncbi:MAG: hypothetical protein AAF579_18685 [Cyanobacteria bacterium P01_C01_bin.118]